MSSNQYGPVFTAPKEFENKAFFLRLGVPSTLIRHENGAFRKRSLNRRKFNRPAFRFRVDENIFWKRSFSRTMASLGAIHLTKISGLRFENILRQMNRNGSGRSRSIPFSRSFNEGCWSLLLVLELNDKFDFINDTVQNASCVGILLGLFLVDPDMCRFSSKIFKHHFRITKRIFETLSKNRF